MKFGEFSGIRALTWFLENPTRRIHFKDLCRELKLGPPTVKTYCEGFIENQWLVEERTANLRLFSLNNGNFVVKAIKRAYFLEKLRKAGLEKITNENAISLALYGSHNSGEYDERSDIDLVVVGRQEDVNRKKLEQIEKKAGKKIQLVVFSLEKWEGNKDKDSFMASVLRNNTVVKGAPL